jgi:hypothetical protein
VYSAYDRYLLSTTEDARNGGLLRSWAEAVLVLYSPVCSYTTYHLWKNVLGNQSPMYDAKWPVFGEINEGLLQATKWSEELLSAVRHKLTLDLKGKSTTDVSMVKVFLSREHPKDVVVVFSTLLEVYKEVCIVCVCVCCVCVCVCVCGFVCLFLGYIGNSVTSAFLFVCVVCASYYVYINLRSPCCSLCHTCALFQLVNCHVSTLHVCVLTLCL